MAPPNTSKTKSRQQAGSLIDRLGLHLTVDEVLIARVVCHEEHLRKSPHEWGSEEARENFYTSVKDSPLVHHPDGISLPGESDPGLSRWGRPLLSDELERRGIILIQSILWLATDYNSIENEPKFELEPLLSRVICNMTDYTRAWWVGAFRDGDTKDDSIARAKRSDYCSAYPRPKEEYKPWVWVTAS